jgi:hypothetical protein
VVVGLVACAFVGDPRLGKLWIFPVLPAVALLPNHDSAARPVLEPIEPLFVS